MSQEINSEREPKIQIIYLNGASSSGKTTIAKALQEVLVDPFLHVSIDKFIGMMPNKINDWTGKESLQGFSWKKVTDEENQITHELQTGQFAKKLVATFQKVIVTMACEGHYLIIDDVSFGKKQVDEWKELLIAFRVLYVGVKAPLELLEAREKMRDNRIAGSSRTQHKKVHTDVLYDVEIDTSEPLNTCLQNIISKLYQH